MPRPTTHTGFGDPDAPHELTKKDERKQEAVDRSYALIRSPEMKADFERQSAAARAAGHDGLAIERPETLELIANIFSEAAQARQARPWEHMRWRVRLFCGHVHETTRPASELEPFNSCTSGVCPECAMEAAVVACAPLGPLGERPAPEAEAEASAAKQKAKRIAVLEAELAQLRRDDST